MKRIVFLALCALFVCASISAKQLIPLSLNYEDDRPIGHDYPKSPTDPPTVYIEDYTLTFENYHPEYILNIKDEDGIVVYSTVVYSTQTQVALPSTLSGNYEIKLVLGFWVFTGWITL